MGGYTAVMITGIGGREGREEGREGMLGCHLQVHYLSTEYTQTQ